MSTKNCSVEALETRRLMDGDVSVVLRSGDLIIRGDSLDNQVVISSPTPGTVRVAGLEETTIGGQAFVDFSAAVDDLSIRMIQGGEDEISVRGAIRIGGDVVAKLGAGDFIIEGSAGPVEIGGDLIVRAAEGNVALRNEVNIKGHATVRAGGSVSAVATMGVLPDFASATFNNSLKIDNPYFPLVVGTTFTYEEESVDDETGQTVIETVIVEVLDQIKTILRVDNRVVRDRVFIDGLLHEDTLDWHAQDDNGNVWYFGEETTSFEYDEQGNLISTSTAGAFEAGVDGAKAGIIMLAKPTVGARYYQEMDPGNALDQAEVLSINDTAMVPVGNFSNAVRTKDRTALEPEGLEHKLYAPGIGLTQGFKIDPATGETTGVLRLVSLKLNGVDVTQLVPPDGFQGVNAAGATIGQVRIGGHTFIRSGGAVVLNETRFANGVQLISKSAVTVVDSVFDDDLAIRAAESAALNDSTFADDVSIRGDLDLYIAGSNFAEEVNVRLGLGDNQFVVADSVFAELTADGWRGENVFADQGGNTFGDLDLLRFEEEE